MQIVLKTGNFLIRIVKIFYTFSKFSRITLSFPTLFKIIFWIVLHFNIVAKFNQKVLEILWNISQILFLFKKIYSIDFPKYYLNFKYYFLKIIKLYQKVYKFQ